MAEIVLEGVTKVFADGTEAVHDLDVEIPESDRGHDRDRRSDRERRAAGRSRRRMVFQNYQRYEGLVVKEQIVCLRQRSTGRPHPMYHYCWSEPWPIMGAGLFDYRRPYQVYEAMKAVCTRVLISLELEADPYIIGREKVYERGGWFRAKVLLSRTTTPTRSTASRPPGRSSRLRRVKWWARTVSPWRSLPTRPRRSTASRGRSRRPARPGSYRVKMYALGTDGRNLSANNTDFTVR